MLTKIFPILFVLFPFFGSAQSIEARKETSRIEGQNVNGYQVNIRGTGKEADNALAKYLKGLGKTRQSGDYITVAEPLIDGKKYDGTLYATIRIASGANAVWMTITGGQEDQSGKNDAAVKKLAHDFGVYFQREQIQAKIDESQRALDAVVKQKARLVKQNEDIHARIESNQRQKIQLEKSLVENKAELETLKNKLAANKKAQDSVEVASSQIKKVVEKHKQEQLLVH
jgi:hypothetical protein